MQTDNKKLYIVRTILCLIIIGIGLTAYFIIGSIKQAPREKNAGQLLKTLIAIPVKKQSYIQKITGYGTAKPNLTMKISSQLKGMVTYINPNLSNGILVQKEEVLAKIDTTDYDIALTKSKAEIKVLQAQYTAQIQDVKNRRQIVENYKHRLDLELKLFTRQKQLSEKNVISRQVYEKAEQNYEQVTNTYLTEKNTLLITELGLDTLLANIEKAKAEILQAEKNIERSVIKAPLTGRLKNVDLEKDEYVNIGQKLFEITDNSSLTIPVPLEANDSLTILDIVPEKAQSFTHWFKYNKDTPVTICWTELPNECQWKGRISRIEKFDTETRTVTVVVKPIEYIGNSSNYFPLVAGMFCEVEFTGKKRENIVKIPWSALQLNGMVFIVDKNGIVHEKKVDIIYSNKDQLIVASGLYEGEQVITQRIPYGVVNGTKVKTLSYEN